MPYTKLPNYLKTYRKRAGLSEDEVAFLLGCAGGQPVSRCEHFHRIPSFRAMLAYRVIFQTSVRELFSGEYQKVERTVARQAERLAERLRADNPAPATARKLAFLQAIVSAATGEQP